MNPLYYYDGSLRWSFYWDNPNCWAAFLVFVLVGAWTVQGVARASRLPTGCVSRAASSGRGSGRPSSAGGTPALPLAAYVVELGVWFLLVKTYSRGGLVAAIVALVLFLLLQGLRGTGDSPVKVARASCPWVWKSGTGCQPVGVEDKTQASRLWHTNHMGESPMLLKPMGWQPMPHNPTGWKPVLRNAMLGILIRVVLIAVFCAVAGFTSRISPSYIAQDKSALNRLDMWHGALVMMKDSPLIGWGNHNGGFSYINWYQSQAASSRPVGFVNSFLDIGVEFGTPVLFLMLGIGLFLLLVAFRHRHSHNTTPALVILAAWGVANIWTSLWRETALWIVPAGCALYLLTVCWRSRRACLKSVAPSFALAAGFAVVLLSVGWAFSGKYEWIAHPSRGTDKIILIKRDSASDAANAPEIWVDGAVLDRYFGKTFRSIASTAAGRRFEIYPPWTRVFEKPNPDTKKVIFMGFQASWLGQRRVLPLQEVVIFYPTVFPPPIKAAGIGAGRISLYMPSASASEYNLAWRRWAERNHVKIITAPREDVPL